MHYIAQISIDLMDAAAKERPFSFRKPWAASSAEIFRSDIRPPLGFCRRSRFARGNELGVELGVALPALALAGLSVLAPTRTPALGCLGAPAATSGMMRGNSTAYQNGYIGSDRTG
jgi:hypothetical protein